MSYTQEQLKSMCRFEINKAMFDVLGAELWADYAHSADGSSVYCNYRSAEGY